MLGHFRNGTNQIFFSLIILHSVYIIFPSCSNRKRKEEKLLIIEQAAVLFFNIIIFLKLKIFFKFYLSIYFWRCWVFVAVPALLQLPPPRAALQLQFEGFLLPWLLLLQSAGSRALGLQSWWLLGSRAQDQQLRHRGLVAPRHVGSSQIKD